MEQLRAAKDRAVVSSMVGMVGGIGTTVGQIGLLANAFAFSREHESRADRLGVRLMQQAGYDGREAANVWDNLLAEMKVTGGEKAGRHGDIFETHPTTAGRRDELLALAGGRGGDAGEDRLRQAIAPLRRAGSRTRSSAGSTRRAWCCSIACSSAGPTTPRCCTAAPRCSACVTKAAMRRAHSPTCSRPWRRRGRRPKRIARWGCCTGSARTAPPPCSRSRNTALAPEAPDAGLVRSYLTEMKP
ncbi:M48 family metalloprotease [Ramlibacter terrae]|uniref:M48 family metalloprotease n=1 Tax=Ramlibacter terrae TaxID=2732511 RepID=A0ABX6P3P7_9BURK|nr:M48 family metalloprotease [Ramlibacter terrae]